MTQQLFFGDECQSKIKDLLQSKRWDRILLVTGKKSYESSGAEKFIIDCLSGIDVEKVRFCNFANNPNVIDLKKGLALTLDFNPSVIMAIGGGSVLDMAKLLRFFMTHNGDVLSGRYIQNEKNVPLIAIPTTAGTGSEATHFAVLYDDKGNKHSLADKTILPDYAVVYPPLTYNLSPYVTACAGFDALAQAIEAYWNKNATEESDRYAEKAMNLIYPSLPYAVNNPTKDDRDKMSEGAYWAGRAINITKTTAPHAFSYPFTSHYGYPHGHAVAIIFPILAEYNLVKGRIPEIKKIRLLRLFNCGIKDLYFSCLKYINALNLNVISNSYDTNILLNGISLERLSNNPAIINRTDALCILNNIIGE